MKNKIFGMCKGRWSKCRFIQDTERKYHSHCLFQLRPISLCYHVSLVAIAYLNSTYVIVAVCSFSFTSIINDMKRVLKKVFKPKKPSPGSIHGPGPVTSTSSSTGATDLMLSIPACNSESDGTTSTQVAAGISVSVQLRLSHL